jgi:putative acetyltransferase
VHIRESVDDDKEPIRILHQNAFVEPKGEIISQLAIDLLEDKTAQPILSLVAEQNNEIIGNAIFSPVKIKGMKEISAYILAPLGVAKDSQRKGVGTKLINRGIETLKKRGAEIVCLTGDPKYYTRTGFKAEHNLEAPYKLDYTEGWMAQGLVEGKLEKTQGMVLCASTLMSQELW